MEKDTVVGCNQKAGHDCARNHKSSSLAPTPLLQSGAPCTTSPKVEGLEMSEVDDIIQTQSRTNHSQEWTKQRRTFLEEKHRLSLLTGKRKPNVPQVDLLEEVTIGVIKLLEMTVVDTERADKPINFPQEEYPQALHLQQPGTKHIC